MEQTNAKLKQYKEGDYLINTIETDEEYSAWLEHRLYGVSSEMFGIAKQAPGLPVVTEEEFLQMVKNELPESIRAYREEYMDEEDLVFETDPGAPEVQECEFDENNTETPQRIVSPYGNDTETGLLITMVGTPDAPLLRLDGDKVLIANISVHGNNADVGHIKVARVGFESPIDLIRGLALCAASTVMEMGKGSRKDREKVKEILENEFMDAMERLGGS